METNLIRTKYAFFTVPSDIWDVPLKLVAKTVYVYLWSRASRTAQAFPSIPRIAKDISASPRSVQYAIRELERYGLLEVEPRYHNGRQTSNLYTLVTPADRRGAPDAPGVDAPVAPEGCTACTGGDAPAAPDPDPNDPDPDNHNSDVVDVIDSYKKGTGVDDLKLSTASKWIQTYGRERVMAKLSMMVDLIRSGHRIRRPQAWLAQALKQDWTPVLDREVERRRQEEDRTRRLLDEARRVQEHRNPAATASHIRELLTSLA